MSELVAIGYARAKAVTLEHAKSFSFASHALFGARRRAAFALYAFCRRLDDVVDAPGAEPTQVRARLAQARDTIASLYRAPATFADPELAALHDAVVRFKIPQEPLQELVTGMEMDLEPARYRTAGELDLYCHRVAGVVGLLMAPVLGCRSAKALDAAEALGRAMQLTNILRDVKEDLARGRLYLPSDELAAFGLTELDVRSARIDAPWQAFMKAQVARARALYAQGASGIAALDGFGAQTLVRVMSSVYGGILGAIERAGYDVFSQRARVSLLEKCWLAFKAVTGWAR